MTLDTPETLPVFCFGILPGARGAAALILIRRGVSGYYPTEGYGPRSEELVDKFNAELGVTPAQRQAMEFGSSFGWNVRGADPENYKDGPLWRAEGETREAHLERCKADAVALFSAKSAEHLAVCSPAAPKASGFAGGAEGLRLRRP